MELCPRRVVFLAVAIAIFGGGCAAGGEEPSPVGPRETSDTSEAADEVARSSEQIDIGGRSLYLQCWGEPVAGEPTVLLLAGNELSTSSWEFMANEFTAEGHHLCAYDRAGVGRSDPAPEARRTTEDQVTDLVLLLDAAGLQEPIVLAAHSLGSLPAVGLVDRAPERVAGVVLIDPWLPRVQAVQRAALPSRKPDEPQELTDERHFLNDYLFDPAQNPEHLLLAACDKEVTRVLDEPGPVFGDLPVIVLRAPPLPPLPWLPRGYRPATLAALRDGYKEFATESTRGTLIEVEDTGHNIQDDQPEIVMDAIRDVMAG